MSDYKPGDTIWVQARVETIEPGLIPSLEADGIACKVAVGLDVIRTESDFADPRDREIVEAATACIDDQWDSIELMNVLTAAVEARRAAIKPTSEEVARKARFKWADDPNERGDLDQYIVKALREAGMLTGTES